MEVGPDAAEDVDLEDGGPVTVGGHGRRVAVDQHLPQLELELRAKRANLLERTPAQVAAGRVVDGDVGLPLAEHGASRDAREGLKLRLHSALPLGCGGAEPL